MVKIQPILVLHFMTYKKAIWDDIIYLIDSILSQNSDTEYVISFTDKQLTI